MKVAVAGFISFHLILGVLKNGDQVVGISNQDNYYKLQLTDRQGIEQAIEKSTAWGKGYYV